jgi:hypothetical protein
LSPLKPLSDDNMEDEAQMAKKEPAEAIPEKEKKFQYSSASSDTDNDNPDNPDRYFKC